MNYRYILITAVPLSNQLSEKLKVHGIVSQSGGKVSFKLNKDWDKEKYYQKFFEEEVIDCSDGGFWKEFFVKEKLDPEADITFESLRHFQGMLYKHYAMRVTMIFTEESELEFEGFMDDILSKILIVNRTQLVSKV